MAGFVLYYKENLTIRGSRCREGVFWKVAMKWWCWVVCVFVLVCEKVAQKELLNQKKVGQEHHKEYVVVVFVGVEQGQ